MEGLVQSWGVEHRRERTLSDPSTPSLVMLEWQATLAQISWVKDVHPDRAVRRAMSLESPDASEAPGSRLVRKRPGRMQTRPTIGLWEDDSNGTLLGRELLASGATLPVRLGADKIWAQGHSGKGIKMGVFDTGIRGDHPHLKNIK